MFLTNFFGDQVDSNGSERQRHLGLGVALWQGCLGPCLLPLGFYRSVFWLSQRSQKGRKQNCGPCSSQGVREEVLLASEDTKSFIIVVFMEPVNMFSGLTSSLDNMHCGLSSKNNGGLVLRVVGEAHTALEPQVLGFWSAHLIHCSRWQSGMEGN